MINELISRFTRSFKRDPADESVLIERVSEERKLLERRRARAQRVLDEFHRSEAVIRREYRGIR